MNRDRLATLDAFLGAPTYRGGVVRNSSGVFTNGDGLLPEDESAESIWIRGSGDGVGPCTAHRHGKLSGEKRCHGCGLTRNEILLNEE